MKGHALAIVDRAITNPRDALGTIERNTEIKVVLFVLCALGWDVASDLSFAFQIKRATLDGAKAANAADFALKDDLGLCAIGEAKQWGVDDRGWDRGLAQVKRYQRALGTPRAFLTCGKRWIVLDQSQNVADDIRVDKRTPNATALVARLEPFLGKGRIEGQVTNAGLWHYGVSPPSVSRRA